MTEGMHPESSTRPSPPARAHSVTSEREREEEASIPMGWAVSCQAPGQALYLRLLQSSNNADTRGVGHITDSRAESGTTRTVGG